jgi:hypothetical protein
MVWQSFAAKKVARATMIFYHTFSAIHLDFYPAYLYNENTVM